MYGVWLLLVPHGLTIESGSLAASLAVAVPAAMAALLLSGWLRASGTAGAYAALALVMVAGALLLLGTEPVAAHDPGQGTVLTDAEVVGTVRGAQVGVTIAVRDCDGLTPVAVRARRAGTVERGSLRALGTRCRFEGEVMAPTEGRWFVYGEFGTEDDGTAEVWIPVASGGRSSHRHHRDLYLAPPGGGSSSQVAAGIVLGLGAATLLARSARAGLRAAPRRSGRAS